MAQKTQSKTSKTTSKTPNGIMTMFVLDANPFEGVAGFQLPAGARLAVVTSKPETASSVARTVGKRFRGNSMVVRRMRQLARAKERAETISTVNKTAFEPDARSQAVLQGVRIAQNDLKAAGGAYDLEQVRTLLHGVSRQAVDKRVQEGSLLAVPGPSNRRCYPTLQFNRDGSVVAGLKEVQDALPVESPWAVLNFLARPDDRLGGKKPIEVLREGNLPLVLEAANRYGEQGA
ncbi:hypothetical protein N5C66_23780 [Rhizobium pusense]|uniref:hypothetical protein n=1 Tax=Agrobacterium TaxID=357 RepID=UPI001F1D533A|nr:MULTISPECIES: hypothetical protein [Agrobacterium]MDH0910565.1 hypothetical protein [Agrobacterium pusense]MDH1098469.1 hypothetical protein [Agrobacterium pusense]MDH1114745.1 hypothetical protein [Agrobacterium pusense]MDH2197009.1 hypothetical protein [Agrobacterium pusense]